MWFNPIIQGLLRSPLHFLISNDTMLMTFTGHKSGRPYTTPMNYLRIGKAFYTISSRDRRWWRNLRESADVTLHLAGKSLPARGDVIEDHTKVADHLTMYLKTDPKLRRYMNVRIQPDGKPNPADIANLAQEKVVVRTILENQPLPGVSQRSNGALRTVVRKTELGENDYVEA